MRRSLNPLWLHRETEIKSDADLIRMATDFREAITLGDSEGYCVCVSTVLQAVLLRSCKINCTMINGSIGAQCHSWLLLEDGRILDATADQFNFSPFLPKMPAVYLGERPLYYLEPPLA